MILDLGMIWSSFNTLKIRQNLDSFGFQLSFYIITSWRLNEHWISWVPLDLLCAYQLNWG